MNIYEWMLQYKRNFIVLPVTGLSLTARQVSNAKRIELKWSTQSEINISGFNITRSSDGINFTNIGFVAAGNTPGSGNQYSFIDESPLAGKDYYRLEVQELTGANSFSDIRMVTLDEYADIVISPNPVGETLNLQTSLQFKQAVLQVFNNEGKLVFLTRVNGSGNIMVKLPALPSGLYSARIANGTNYMLLQFIKQ